MQAFLFCCFQSLKACCKADSVNTLLMASTDNKKIMINETDYDDLLKACYQGPLEAKLWQTFLYTLKAAMNARYVTLMLRPPQEGDLGVMLNAHQLQGQSYNSYRQRFHAQNPFIDLPVNQAVTLDEIIDRETLKASEYYQQYLTVADVEYLLGVGLQDDKGYSARLVLSRGSDDNNFTEAEKKLLERLAPHLTQAIVLYSRIVHAEAQSQTYEQAFDQMEMGCITLDRQLKITSCNRAAENLIAQKSSLSIKDKQLFVGTVDENRQFRKLLGDLLNQPQAGEDEAASVRAFRVNLPHTVTGLGLLCRRLQPLATPDAGASVAVFISDPERPRLSKIDILSQLFSLTASEARLALLLANGSSLDEAAEEQGITRNTAKSHLSAVFSKTGVTRQPSLVQLILRSVATIG